MEDVHTIYIQKIKEPLGHIEANSNLLIQLAASCSRGCNLSGKTLKVLDDAGSLIEEVRLTGFDGIKAKTEEFSIKVPQRPGPYLWKIFLPEQASSDPLHGEASATLVITIQPHMTSLAVWDFPSVTVMQTSFKAKVGANCIPVGCPLTDYAVVVYDEKGTRVAEGRLGPDPYPGTKALYWTEVELRTPEKEGPHTWEAILLQKEESHALGSYQFSFLTARPPECAVIVDVLATATKAPIEGAIVLLDHYQGITDINGFSRMDVPKGNYQLMVAKDGYHSYQSVIDVQEERAVKVELSIGPSYSYSDIVMIPFDQEGGAEDG